MPLRLNEIKNRMDLLVKLNALHTKSHERREEVVENEESISDGVQKILKQMYM